MALLQRDVLKWLQSLDLSYSVKDQKRDLVNGFIIAEVFSRYYPEKMSPADFESKRYCPVSMHSFTNSQSEKVKRSNWEILGLFFKRNRECGNEMPFKEDDFHNIQFNDYNQLKAFVSKMYTFLTQKKLQEPPLQNLIDTQKQFASSQFTNAERDLGTSFVLRDKGLERLEDRNAEKMRKQAEMDQKKAEDLSPEQMASQASLQNQPKKTTFLRNYSKPMGEYSGSTLQKFEVKNVNVRTDVKLAIKDTRAVQQHQQKSSNANSQLLGAQQSQQGQEQKSGLADSPSQHSNEALTGLHNPLQMHQSKQQASEAAQKRKQQERTVYDILNDMMNEKLQQPEFASEMSKVKVKNNSVLQCFVDNLEIFADDFCISFFSEIQESLNDLLRFLSKDPNEHWKFMNFMFQCLKGLGPDKQSFRSLVNLICAFGEDSLNYNQIVAARTRIMFKDSSLHVLAHQIKNSFLFERKEMLVNVLYYYCPKEAQSRHELVAAYKLSLNDMQVLMQSLVILISKEKQQTPENQIIIDDVMHYANTHLFAASTNLRVMALALFDKLVMLVPDQVMPIFMTHLPTLAKFEWWESRCLLVSILAKIIQHIVRSPSYQALVKQATQAHKQFSLENEQKVSQMKDKIGQLAQAVKRCSFPPQSEMVLRCAFIAITPIVGEHKDLLDLLVNLLLLAPPQTRSWALYSPVYQYVQPADTVQQQQQYQYLPNPFADNDMDFLVLSDKSLRHQININSDMLHSHASDILLSVVDIMPNIDSLEGEYMELVNYGFNFTDFKQLNMEQCENVCNVLKEHVFSTLCDPAQCQSLRAVFDKMIRLQFYSEVKINDSAQLMWSAILQVYQDGFEQCIQNLESILQELINEGFGQGVELCKQFLLDVYKGLYQKKLSHDILTSTKLGQILQPVKELIEVEASSEKQQNTSDDNENIKKQPQKQVVSNNGNQNNDKNIAKIASQEKSQQGKQDLSRSFQDQSKFTEEQPSFNADSYRQNESPDQSHIDEQQ